MMNVVLSAALFGLVAAVIWGMSAVIAKRALTNGGSPLLLASLASLVGTCLFWGILVVQRGSEVFAHLTPTIVVIFAVAGVTASCIGRVTHFEGINRVGATIANAAVTAHPMFAVTIALLFIGEPVRPIEFIGMLVIIVGLLVLTISKGGDIEGWKGWEVLIPISAAFLFAIADVLRRYAFVSTTVTAIEGAAVNSVAALSGFVLYIVVGRRQEVFRVARSNYAYIAIAVILTPLGLLMLLTGLSLGRVIVVVPLAATAPLFTIVFSYFLIDDLERVTRGIVAGSVSIVLGIYLITGV